MNMDDSTLIIAILCLCYSTQNDVCIFDKNLIYQHVPGQDSSPQLRGPDNTYCFRLDEVGQSTHFKRMTSLGMKRGEQSGSLPETRAHLEPATIMTIPS